MKGFVLLTCFFVAGCQSFNTNYISIIEAQEQREIIREDARIAVINTTTNIEKQNSCTTFTFPLLTDTPPLPVALLKKYAATDRRAYDELMLRHVTELRLHIKRYKLTVERARIEHEKCHALQSSNK